MRTTLHVQVVRRLASVLAKPEMRKTQAARPPGAERGMMKHEGADAWKNNLIASPAGVAKPLLANAITAFRDCLSWHNVLAFDAFEMRTVLGNAPPWHAD